MSITRYLGVINSPSLAPAGIHERTAIICFTSLQQAKDTLDAAASSSGRGWQFHSMHGRNLKGEQLLDMPGLDREDTELTLWVLDGDGGPDDIRHDVVNCWEVLHEVEAYPDYVLRFGPRGGIIRDRC